MVQKDKRTGSMSLRRKCTLELIGTCLFFDASLICKC